MQSGDLMGNTCESLVEMVGTPFDGLIGTDILGEFDLEISLGEGTLTLSVARLEMPGGLPVESLQGVPIVECQINGQPVRMFFDTGAPLSYLSEACVQGCTALGEVEDFHPLLGRFRVPTFAVPVQAWGHAMNVRAGQIADVARDGARSRRGGWDSRHGSAAARRAAAVAAAGPRGVDDELNGSAMTC